MSLPEGASNIFAKTLFFLNPNLGGLFKGLFLGAGEGGV